MYLKKVIVENYRIFDNVYEFEFGNDFENNLNVIFGPNSSGKSSLVNAIHWCLYAREFYSSVSEPLYNYESSADVGEDERISVSVECHFLDGENIIKIKRESIFIKTKNDFKFDRSNFNIIRDDGENVEKLDDYWLYKGFPYNLVDFSFFDPKYLDSFFEKDFEHNFKRLFFDYFKLDHIETTIMHFGRLSHNLRNDLRKSNFHHAEHYHRELNQYKEKYLEVQQSIHKLDDSIKDIEMKIIQYSHQLNDLSPDFKKIEHIEHEIDSKTKKITDLEKNYQVLLLKTFPIALVFDKFIESNDSFNNEDLENRLLKNANSKNSKFYEGYFNIKFTLNQLDNLEDIKGRKHELMQLNNEIKKLSIELQEIEYSIENMYLDPYFKKISKETKNLRGLNEMHLAKKENLKNEKRYLKRNIERLSKLLNDIGENKPLFERDELKYKLCQDAISLGNDLKKEISENAQLKFNEILNNIFINDLKMSTKFIQVNISSDFNIRLINNHNMTFNPNKLSYSDKFVFIIALLISIHEFFKIEYPLILIDPFVYLDNENRNNVIKRLVGSTSINQIILILNESQYGDNVKVNLIKKIANEYELKNSSKGFKVIKHG